MDSTRPGLILKQESHRDPSLDHYFFLNYINDISDGLTSNPKFFADDNSLFSVIHNINSTANDLNSDLMTISNWAFQWKMSFSPNPNKQPQEVIFNRKINKIDHPPLYLNQNLVKSSSSHKHLGMVFVTGLDFNLHLKNVQNKVNITIGLLLKLQKTLARTPFITIFKLLYNLILIWNPFKTMLHKQLRTQ